ncbi:hypothetical protein [Marinobacter nauticus]|uniref:Uncharacterized protein n=1 Tax=Marinobacter nauticus TaxID=2743 RepID=A0A368VA26_MARNT|nr:hypothetical protein [Marinobacter nauticus]MBY6102524.1 hypothetical protein [Marinobacter nauticus]RBP77163.1 hypothetical protein DET64_101353 [Marinobacter nauticus]RCW38009.1 hypothetical protein DET51_101352 [Marinobacter nauticus]
MAENTAVDKTDPANASGAVLRPGRAADPVPATPESALNAAQRTAALQADDDQGQNTESGSEQPEAQESQDRTAETGSENPDIEQALAESRQRKLRLMLRQCDRVLLMDFNLLAMSDWPDNYQMAAARRSRDLWIFSALLAATFFLSGLTGFVPAWVAGGGFGAFVIILLLGVPFIRRIYTSSPSYMDLIIRRQRMLRDARKHAAHLEGKDGLIWQCARMAEYNPTLRHTRFSELLRLSEQRVLPRYLTRREHVRLYLIYLLEAEKAYGKVQQAFFDGNQDAIDRGWQAVAAVPEDRA